MARPVQVAIDCADPARLARFWADVLQYPPPQSSDDEWVMIGDPDGVGPPLLFHRVPEGKVGKNRVHLDIRVAGDVHTPIAVRRPAVDAEARRLVDQGATHLHTVEDEVDYFAVMQDPEGNEFCVG